MTAQTIATAAMCALWLASPCLFWAGCNRAIKNNATLMACLELVRLSTLAGFAVYMYVFYVRRWPFSVAGAMAWASPVVALNVLGVALILAGQWLNVLVYRRIGIQGVYYGFEYGLTRPDPTVADSFPFNAMQHPQYVGGILTALGIWAIAALNRRDRSVRWPVAIIAATAVAAYLAGMAIESPGCVIPPASI